MELFYRLSLRIKITSIIIFTVLLILGIGFGIEIYNENHAIKERAISEKSLTAKIVSSYAKVDLYFNNPDTAYESLSYLKTDKSVINAHLFDSNGNIFVSLYKNTPPINSLPETTTHWHQFIDDELHIIEPIHFNAENIGKLYLQTSISEQQEMINELTINLALILLGLLFLATFIAGKLSTLVTKPLFELINATKSVSEQKDYNIRIKSKSKDETSQLVTEFNNMLSKIASREGERDVAISQLSENEANLKLILDNMIDSIITINEDGIILSFNKASEALFGYSEEEAIGQPVRLIMPESHASHHNGYIQEYLKTGKAKIIGIGRQLSAINKNGQAFPIRLSIAELPVDKNGKHQFIASCHDLTLANQQDELLRRTQKMDALGKLTGGVAHDYNNMLGVITGYSELLENQLSDNPKLEKYAHEINRAALRGAKLTKKLLSFSRKQPSETEPVNLNLLLQEERHMLEKTLTVRIKLTLELEQNLWCIWTSSSDLEDAILNICINAMHAIEANGELKITTQNTTINMLDGEVLGIEPGDYASISFSDNGCGMNETTRNKIFDPFFSTKGDKGTGLGLSQVYGFVQRSNGAIKVYSIPGHGTNIILYFPRHDLETSHTITTPVEQKTSFYGEQTILIVDDEESLADLAADILNSHGYKTLTSYNPEQALETLDKQPVDLVFSDVIMPEMTGFELADVISKKFPDIQIQLASGYNSSRDQEDSQLSRELLEKPYTANELLECIKKALEKN